MVLISWLAIGMGGVIVHEQAASSLMLEHDRWVLLRSVVRVPWLNMIHVCCYVVSETVLVMVIVVAVPFMRSFCLQTSFGELHGGCSTVEA